VELNKVDSKDKIDFKVAVTRVSDGIKQEIKEALLSSPLLQRNISAGRMAEPGVNLAGLEEFARGGRAKKMITDNR